MTRIFIEGYELDVNEGFSNQLNFSIDDLTKLDTKTTSFSKTIILPGTAKNNKLLGNIFEFGNSNFTSQGLNVGYNFNASKSAQARIEVDGLQVMKGVLRLMEIIRDGDYIEYEVAIFGELGGFFSKLGAKKLQDLDFSDYNHQYTITNIVNSWNTLGSTGYCYPLIEYGNTSYQGLKHDFYYTAFRPALFVREYIDKIISGAGYTWESNFFDSNFFKRLIIPNNQNKLSINKKDLFFGKFKNATITNPSVYGILTLENVIAPLFSASIDNKTFTYTGASSFTGVLNYRLTGSFSSIRANGVYTGNRISATLVAQKNGNVLYRSNAISFGGTAPVSNRTFDLNFENIPISLVNNDNISFKIQTFDSFGATMTITVNGSIISIISENQILSPVLINDNIIINDTIPINVLQKDFFASILKMFNLMITEDKYKEKHLVIEPYIDFYDTSNYLDWSNIVDRSKPIRIKPMSEINARYYTIKYKQDSDYFNEAYRKKYNEGYGDRTYDNQLEFAKDKDDVEIIFSNSVLVGYSGEDKVFPAIYKLNNNIEETIEHNIRIMQIKKKTGVNSWTIKNSTASTLSTNTNYLYAGHLDDPDAPNADLCFGVPNELQFELVSGALSNNLFNAYYSPYFAEITDKDSRLLKCKIKFNLTDIYNIDFRKFIRIDGVLYRLYKITDWVDGEVCDVELLRVNYTTY